jgi:Ca-activated chloride channel family protein
MFFRSYGTNPFVDTEDDPLSTFGLDVDTGSYTLARSYLERGHLPPPEAIRVEEFINFFDYGDPSPRRGEFTMTAEGAPSPWARGPRYQLLRIGIHGREVPSADRQDATLIFVVDVSGSMARENRIGLVKRALHLLLDQLGPGDRVGLVAYGSRGQVLLEPSRDLLAVRRAIDRLATGGSTNAEEGLLLGFDLARRYFHSGGINRVILCSDGVANVGRTGPESILARIAREAEEGIELTTVGFGMGNYNDVLMEQLADQGDGNYAYVDTLEEAQRVFVENLTATLQTIASDAKVQVEFDPRTVSRYRLLGYENRDVADQRFRDDTVDAGEIGAGHAVTALYEIKLAEDAPRRGPLGEARLRYRSRATGRVVEDSLEIRRSLLARDWRSASASLRLASVAAEVAEILKGSFWVREADVEGLLRRAEAVRLEFRGDPAVAELVDLVRRVCRKIEQEEGLQAPE